MNENKPMSADANRDPIEKLVWYDNGNEETSIGTNRIHYCIRLTEDKTWFITLLASGGNPLDFWSANREASSRKEAKSVCQEFDALLQL